MKPWVERISANNEIMQSCIESKRGVFWFFFCCCGFDKELNKGVAIKVIDLEEAKVPHSSTSFVVHLCPCVSSVG